MAKKIRPGIRLAALLVILALSFSVVSLVSAQQGSVSLNPSSGTPGTTVTVTGTGFPANAQVMVGPGVFATEPVSTQTVTTDAQGKFTAQVTIPDSAQADERWVIMANILADRGASILADFDVVQSDPQEQGTYTVQRGDSLISIARRYNTTLTALLRANPQINNPNLIYPGQQINLPGTTPGIPTTGEQVYIVVAGDRLYRIAQRFNVTLAELLAANPDIQNPNRIYPGQRLVIPGDDTGEEPDEPTVENPEPIMILAPASGSRVLSPVTIRGIADPAHEQQLDIRIYQADGTLLTESTAAIDAPVGERGEYMAEVPFDVEGEENVFIQVFRRSARDGNITHLSSVGVTFAGEGQEEIRTQAPYSQRIEITEPRAQPVQTISGGTAHVEGFGLASFEQTLVVEVQDAMGNVVGQTSTQVNAPALGEPGSFTADVSYSIDNAQPGRIVVRDPSPAFGGDVYLTSVDVQLQP